MASRSARRIAGFALRFALAYAVLLLAWPLVAPVYRTFYCTLGNALFQGGEGSVTFRAKDTRERLDVEVEMTKRDAPRVTGSAENDSHMMGYLPTVTLVALVLSTPIPWKRRRRALWVGLALVTLFVALRMAIPIIRDYSNPDALQIYELGPFARWALGISNRALLNAPASFFVVPILIWVLVAFRRQDWEILDEDGRAGQS